MIPEKSIHVIHGHTRVTQVMTTILGGLTQRAYVTTCHGFYKTRWSRMVFPCWGEAAIAISPLVEEHLVNDFRTPQSRVFLIPHGVHIPQFSPMPLEERRTGLRGKNVLGHPVIGIIARLADIKGHDVLIRAMPRVLEKLPKAQLVIVGTGKMEQKLHDLVKELGLKSQVLFFPVTHRTAEFMPLFDLFVLPSIEEGLGLSVLEAQACGLPVVASDVGGLKTLVKTGSTGILVEPGQPDKLAEAILDILSNPERAEAMGQAARRFIKQNHSAPRMAQETLDVYQHVLERRKKK